MSKDLSALGTMLANHIRRAQADAVDLGRALTHGFFAEIESTPGASAAAKQAMIGLEGRDPVVRAEWAGIDELRPTHWPEFARRRATLERELARQRDMQVAALANNRKRHHKAEARRAKQRAEAETLRAAHPDMTEVEIAEMIFASLPAGARAEQSSETIRKNIRRSGKAL